jgi:hypothetical protein
MTGRPTEQPAIDLRDTRLALGVVLDTLEWLLIREKARLGPADVRVMLQRIDMARDVVRDETESND